MLEYVAIQYSSIADPLRFVYPSYRMHSSFRKSMSLHICRCEQSAETKLHSAHSILTSDMRPGLFLLGIGLVAHGSSAFLA